VAAVIQQGDRYLITQRRPTALLPLMWEFPGGRVEPDESDSEALRREVFHRLQVTVEVGQLMSYVCHKYDKYVVDLHLYQCTIRSGEIHNANVNNHAWVRSDEFDQYLFTPADSTRA
jgi:8-oxo-dGTP diphosphatase